MKSATDHPEVLHQAIEHLFMFIYYVTNEGPGLSIHRSIYLSIYLPIDLLIDLSIDWSKYVSID